MAQLALVISLAIVLGVFGTIICMLSLVPLGAMTGVRADNLWQIAQGVGTSITVGGLVIIILAVCFTYNKPDPPSN